MTRRRSESGAVAPRPGGHTPVMLREVIAALAPRDGGIYVDGTFGAGGYATAIADAAETQVFGIDRDPAAVAAARELVEPYRGRLTVIEGRYGDMDRLLADRGVEAADGVALDLGVSSMQLDTAERGFSFRHDAPLNMRMDSQDRATAADVVNDMAEDDLADIIWRYGEERRARRVARAIVAARRERRIERTIELAEVVRGAVGGGAKAAGGIDPATRTFQALRIHVNDELGELTRGLSAAERLLAPGGRLAVVAFHSLEDRIVKDFLKDRSGATARAPRHRPEPAGARPDPTFEPLFKGPCRPSQAECDANPRARSARLRAAARTAAPAWPGESGTEGRPS
jgi:16S rRNA (cytosine1402-N4)-methyltransferase